MGTCLRGDDAAAKLNPAGHGSGNIGVIKFNNMRRTISRTSILSSYCFEMMADSLKDQDSKEPLSSPCAAF